MKKTISFLSLLFGLFVCVTAFSACGGDDEPSSGGNSGSGSSDTPQTSKHVSKIITEEGNSIIESTLTYDSQGRVTKIIATESGTGTNSRSEKTYQYGETLILTKEVEEGKLSNGQSYVRSESHSFTIENGLIVKEEEKNTYDGVNHTTPTHTFSYDANKYLSSISRSYPDTDNESKAITWSDGNLTKLGNRSFEYSSYSWAKGFPFYIEGSNVDEILFANGYYGNIPKNLQSKTYTSEKSGWTFEYTIEGNYVTKVVISHFEDASKTQTMTFVWE